MDFIHDFDNEFLSLLPYCEQQIRHYPEPFCTIGLEELRRHDVTKSKRTSYICYLLAFWLKDEFNMSMELCRKVSIGGIFGMLYFFAQDDLIDSENCENRSEKVLLANLYFGDFIKEYQRLFASESSFWTAFQRHISEWVICNHWEKTTHRNVYADYTEEDLIRLAGKTAPLKIVCDALVQLSGREELVETVYEAIDAVLVSMQMVDDLGDWEKDIVDGNGTYFLTEAMKYNRLIEWDALTVTNVRQALYFGGLVEKLIVVIERNGSKLEKLPLDIPYFKKFNELLRLDCQNVLQKMNNRKRELLDGGLDAMLKRCGAVAAGGYGDDDRSAQASRD